MERPPRLKGNIAIIIIVLFHLAGVAGFLTPALIPLFKQLVPFHLVVMLLIVVFSHNQIDLKSLLFFILVFCVGFMAEWIGVHKHWLFGNYRYGQALGLKLFDIPLSIGINWFMLIYTVGVFMHQTGVGSLLLRVFGGAILLVLLDMLIEPVAIRFDYWHWASAAVPFTNLVGWFLVSAVLLFTFEAFQFKKQNRVAPALLMVQFIFFAILRWA